MKEKRYALLEWPILQNNEEGEGAQPAERNEVTAETEDAKIEQIENRQLRNRENIQPPARYRDDIVACAAVVEEPQTYEEAKSSNEMQQWQEAMEEEIRSLNKNNTWTLVPLPENRKSDADKCVFFTTIEGIDCYVALYVDDALILCESTKIIDEIVQELRQNFEITIGDGTFFCGLEIQRNREKKEIFINQSAYINRILHKFNMNECKPISVPCAIGVPLHNGQSPQDSDEKNEMSNKPYREAVGSLMFAATVSRPDIMFAVNQVSRFLNNPGREHWCAVKRILKYLQGTKNIGIRYNGDLQLTIYSDADFAGDCDTRRSTTGYA
ncbi:Reverse transcriptase (RNA-dependent DNA polymerase) [Popillia japonica]|uniref:Reverse transcriptase (RNA-dependent DNA polymerase) n=1 Tax=Popillia japonica TaxID=7064 RepID=A0AAW1IVB7_POPJA